MPPRKFEFQHHLKRCGNSSQSLDMSSLIKPKQKTKTNKRDDDTTKEQNQKKSKTNNVLCISLKL